MNLNSYIGLMGHSFDVRHTPQGQVLAPAGASGSIVIPDATTCSPWTRTACCCRSTACAWCT